MSSDLRRPSFLLLVPTWQRPYLPLSDMSTNVVNPVRRDSVVSISSSSSSGSSLSSLSTDYGARGFLILTSEPNTDNADDEE